MSCVIEFEGVSKRFVIHRRRARTLRERVLGFFEGERGSREELWALRDVSLRVEPGDCLGIIGANGSGKSTTLKLMTRILQPTSGRVQVRGRVSALLELGAGFHPDLTGRENVYLNGSVLGLSRQTIKSRFDEIVAFAEMERFIDMPVKHYSSGMYMRLAFAIAINVDPDILLTDEVLAVGDQSFQAKCMERIGDLKRSGVTTVFVSHSLETVRSLCNTAIWLADGQVAAEGDSDRVVEAYLASVAEKEESRLAVEQPPAGVQSRLGSGEATILDVRFLGADGRERHTFAAGGPLTARIRYRASQRVTRPVFGVAIYHSDGIHINGPNTRFAGYDIDWIEGEGEMDYVVESLPLLEGSYDFSVSIYDHSLSHAYDHQQRAYRFLVTYGPAVGERFGLVYIPSRWEHRRL